MKAKLHVHIHRGKKEEKRGSSATVLRIRLQVNPETDKHSSEVLKFTRSPHLLGKQKECLLFYRAVDSGITRQEDALCSHTKFL